MKRINFDLAIYVIFFLCILIIIWPLLGSSFFSIHDETHIVDLYEMYRSLSLGGFPPRWAPDFNFGLGYPYFNFYYHLPFYITGFFMFLGLPMTTSFKMFMLLVVVSAGVGFFFFLRKFFSVNVSAVSSLVYLYSPYFAVDLYVRGALGELAIFAVLPWALWAVAKLIERPSLLNFVVSSFILGLLGISHNVLNIFTFPLVFIFGIVLTFSIKGLNKKILFFLVATFLVSVLLTSYYLVPAFLEKQFISDYEQIKIEDHFPFIRQLIWPFWGYGVSVWGIGDGMSFNIGLINLLAVVIFCLMVFKIKRQTKFLGILFLTIFLLSVGLMNFRTYPFWNFSSFLRYIQFPWRLLLFTTFSSAFILAVLIDQLEMKKNKLVYFLIVFGVLTLTVGLNYYHYSPSEYKEISDERYLELYFANRTLDGDGVRENLSRNYLNFAEDFIPPTKWQKHRPKSLPKELVTCSSCAKISYRREGFGLVIGADAKVESDAEVFLSYFPGWVALKGQERLKLYPIEGLGNMKLKIPQGESLIRLEFKDTPVRKSANIVSLLTSLFLIGLIGLSIIKRRKNG